MRLKKVSTAIISDNRRKQGRMGRFVALVIALFVTLGAVTIFINSGVFTLKKVLIYGNRHLDNVEVVKLMGIHERQNLATLSLEEVYDNLHSSPWIRSVSMRKELPDTLVVRLQESRPVALLQSHNGMFIVDSEGLLLERVSEVPVYFLPVIVHGSADGSPEYREAVKLADVINSMSQARDVELVEIAGIDGGGGNLIVRLDGMDIKVGQGKYREKLSRFFDLSGEIGRRNINVDYVDLRFANRVVVKPIEEVVQ